MQVECCKLPSGLTLNLIQEGAAIRPSRLATRPSPFATRHSPLATRHSPLAIRHSICLTPNPSPEERGAGLVWRIYVRLLYRLCFDTIAFIQKNRLRCHSPLAIRHSPLATHPSPLALRTSHIAHRTSHIPPIFAPNNAVPSLRLVRGGKSGLQWAPHPVKSGGIMPETA